MKASGTMFTGPDSRHHSLLMRAFRRFASLCSKDEWQSNATGNHAETRNFGGASSGGFIAAVFLSLIAGQANAASVSYVLDQSNALPDGTNYLSVTLSESLAETGVIDVSVQTLTALNDISGSNFGIQKFGFNFSGSASDVFDLPAGWSLQTGKNMSEFGLFDIRLRGTGSTRTDLLTFSLQGAGLDDIGSLFAAHVAGFDAGKCLTSAYFGGSSEPSTVVPLPPAIWLFGSGLLSLWGLARRNGNAINHSEDKERRRTSCVVT